MPSTLATANKQAQTFQNTITPLLQARRQHQGQTSPTPACCTGKKQAATAYTPFAVALAEILSRVRAPICNQDSAQLPINDFRRCLFQASDDAEWWLRGKEEMRARVCLIPR